MFIECLNSEIFNIEYRNIQPVKGLSLLLRSSMMFIIQQTNIEIYSTAKKKYSTIVEYSNDQLMKIEILRQ